MGVCPLDGVLLRIHVLKCIHEYTFSVMQSRSLRDDGESRIPYIDIPDDEVCLHHLAVSLLFIENGWMQPHLSAAQINGEVTRVMRAVEAGEFSL